MSTWPEDELQEIVASDDLHIAPFREDGKTFGTPTWIWCVAVDGELYVRAYNGQNSSWYQAAVREGSGRIEAAGKMMDVNFETVDDASLASRIDQAYRAKYEGSRFLEPMMRRPRPLRDHQDRTPRKPNLNRKAMPHVVVKLWPGKSEQEKQQLADAITRNVQEILGYGEASVSVAMEEVSSTDWKEKVYDPYIIEGSGKLYKEPGYSM